MRIFHRHPKARYGHLLSHRLTCESGMTLFELMIVLAIMGLMLSLIAPLFTGRIEVAQLISQSEEIAAQIRQAPIRARFNGQTLSMNPDHTGPDVALYRLETEDNWPLNFEGDLIVSALGICSGGRVHITAPSGRRRTVEVAAPFCEATVLGGPSDADRRR